LRKYTTVQGDTWDLISFGVYGNDGHQDLLIDTNWQHRMTVLFSAGVELDIPELPSSRTVTPLNLPPWRRS
jgi:phage tail protein X